MVPERYLMGLFTNEDQVVCTVGALKKSVYQFHRVNSPFLSHKIMAALKLKKSAFVLLKPPYTSIAKSPISCGIS